MPGEPIGIFGTAKPSFSRCVTHSAQQPQSGSFQTVIVRSAFAAKAPKGLALNAKSVSKNDRRSNVFFSMADSSACFHG
jgi:hypothetical protein